MALTRKLLKGMGLTEEQVDTIIEAHTDTTDGLKADLEKYKAAFEKLPTVQKELDDLKAAGDGGYKEKYEREHKAFEDFKRDQTAKEVKGAKEKAYRNLLKSANVAEKYIDDIMGVAKLEDLELVDGKIKDAEKLTKAVQEKYGSFIEKTSLTGTQTANPPANNVGGQMTRQQIMGIKDATARQKAIAENMNLFTKG